MRMTRQTLRLPDTVAPIDARWLADAEMVIAAIEPMGTFEKPLVLDESAPPSRYYYQ